MEEKDIMLNSKDNQILCLLNQIATDMVKRFDMDEIVIKAVSEEHDRLVSYYERLYAVNDWWIRGKDSRAEEG